MTNIMTLNTAQLIRLFSVFAHRYHVLIFTVIAAGGLSVATFLLYNSVNTPSVSTTSQVSNGFDTATMNKIDSLRSPGDPASPLSLPAGRTNPFQE